MADKTKRGMIIETVRRMPDGTKFTARSLAEDIKREHPKTHITPTAVGSFLRECGHLVETERHDHVYHYTRRGEA